MKVISINEGRGRGLSDAADALGALRAILCLLGLVLVSVGTGLMLGVGAAFLAAGVVVLMISFHGPFWRI
jgi:hypothetical protein